MTIAELVRRSKNDSIALPFFQRDYVWLGKDITPFLDSILEGWPVGSIILWDKRRAKGRKFGFLRGKPVDITADALVLDGQQRITTLQALREDGRIELTGNYGKTALHYFSYDLEEKKFVETRDPQDPRRYVDSRSILRGNINIRGIANKFRKRAKGKIRALRSMSEYAFPVIHTSAANDEVAIKIFNRVNATGRKVDKVELAFARLRHEEPEVSGRMVDFQSEWQQRGYDLTARVLMNSFLITQNIKFGDYLTTRNADGQIQDYLEQRPKPPVLGDLNRTFSRIDSALDFLKNLGFDSDQFLPSENVIAALAGYFERHDSKYRDLKTGNKNNLRKWLFRTLLFGRYTYSTNFEQDLRDIQNRGRPSPSRWERMEKCTEDGLIGVMYAIGRKNGMTDYRGEGIIWANTAKTNRVIHVDHIYPRSRLTNGRISEKIGEKESEELADSVGNKAFAIGETNLSKNKKFPGGRMNEVTGQWLDGVSMLSDTDYARMQKYDNALVQNCDEIKDFVSRRQERIFRDISEISR